MQQPAQKRARHGQFPQKKVPVTILTGFLGSGKTTLLNHILSSDSHNMRFAIIENEFGAVSVDDKAIVEASDEQIIEVVNGCICCTVRGDLALALKRLAQKTAGFDGIIIETTGMADPAPVAQTFFIDSEINKFYDLDGIITVVDAMHVTEHLHEEKPEGVVNECVEQLAFADRILLNKCDLVEEDTLDQVSRDIRSVNANAEIIRTEFGQVEPSKLIGIKAFSVDQVLKMDPEFLNNDSMTKHDSSVSSVSVRFEGELNHQQLKMWLSDLMEEKSKDLFRYKGVLAVKGMARKFIFQGVHMLFNGSYEARFRWQPREVRECRLVFIGRNLDQKALEDGVMACKVKPLRFGVGAVVEANCDQWMRGTVIKLWDEGNPYRIRLQNGEECWGPVDTDEYVRKPACGMQQWPKGAGKQQWGKGKGRSPWWHQHGPNGECVEQPWRAQR